MVKMSHQLGRKVTVHARYAETIKTMVRHGVDWVLHASHLRAEDVGLVRDAGIPLCPTVTFAQNIIDYGKECGSEPGHIEFRKREVEGLVKTYRRAYEAGIPIMAGTESGFSMCPYGEWHAKEIELLVTLFGLSAMHALQAMTINNAKAVGWEGDIGTVEAGKFADLLIVDGNPLDDVRLLQDPKKIRHVFKGGVEVVREPVATRPRLGHERGFAVSVVMYNFSRWFPKVGGSAACVSHQPFGSQRSCSVMQLCACCRARSSSVHPPSRCSTSKSPRATTR